MRKLIIFALIIVTVCTLMGVTTLNHGDVITQYDTKQAFVAGSTDYAVSEVFDGRAFSGKICTVTVVTPDSTVNTGATAAKYLVATLQGATSQNGNYVEIGAPMLWNKLCLVVSTADAGSNNKGQSDTFVIDLRKSSFPYLRVRYDVYVAGTRKTDVTTAGTVKTIISTGKY